MECINARFRSSCCQDDEADPRRIGFVYEPSFAGPEAVLLEMSGNPRWNLDLLDWRGVVTERWKYAFFETGQEILFDLADDPYERLNIANENHEQRKEMKRLLLDILEESREPFFDVIIKNGVPPDRPDLDVSIL